MARKSKIKGYGKLYTITSDGKIYLANGKKRKLWLSHAGYENITLSVGGKKKPHLVNRLVAKTFIPNPKHLPVVNHKDGNRLNNHVSNLEWCSYSDNLRHAFRTGLRTPVRQCGEDHPGSKLTEIKVKEIRRRYARGVTSTYLADLFGVTPQNIRMIVTHKTWI